MKFANLLLAFIFATTSIVDDERLQEGQNPHIDFQTQWGRIQTEDDEVILLSNAFSGYGHWRDDGKLEMTWVFWSTDGEHRLGIGLYEFKDDEFIGEWGWFENVQFNAANELEGQLQQDKLTKNTN